VSFVITSRGEMAVVSEVHARDLSKREISFWGNME
jgi:hypothetical protein